MGTYNVSKIEGWLEDFTSAKNKFNNTYYSDYKNSYIRSCSDSAVIRMRNKLNQHYDRIIRINNRIKNVWDDFLYDLKAVDNRLAGGKGSTNDSTVAAKLAKLPSLKEYKADLKVRINSASAVVGTVDAIGWSEDKTLEENLQNSLEILGSTAAVTATSVVSGIFGLAEDLVDGVLLLGTQAVTGVATLFGEEEWAESAQNTMMDVISFDAVGEANKAFYENTSVGREINENSLIKYDSEIAQGIQDASTKLAEFAAATALTVATGGVAAPVAILIVGGTGYLIGSGDKAQESFSEEDRDFWEDSKETTIAGGIKAVEFYSEGKMGAGMVQAAGAIQSAGGVTNFLKNMRTALSNGKSSLFTRESLKNGFRATLKDADTYIDSIGAAFNNITYDSENGLQVNWEGLVQETACNFALNSVFGFVGNSFETRMTSGMESLGLNAKSPDVNTSGMKNTIDDVNTNKAMFSSASSKPKTDSNITSLRKEYDELLKWKSSEKFKTQEAYWQVYGDRIGGNPYKQNMDRLNELYEILRADDNLKRKAKISKALEDFGILGDENKKITEAISEEYANARVNANGKYNETFVSYRDHGELHVLEVADYSRTMAQKNVHLNNLDIEEVYFAGLTHDLGMEDALALVDKKTGEITIVESKIDGGLVRGSHPINSAISILSDGDRLLPKGMDKDKVALLALSHSKSTSGIEDFSNKSMWLDSIDRLDKVCKETGIAFDADRMRSIINNDNLFRRLQEQAVCLRDGDAMSKVIVDTDGNQVMQTGDSVKVINNSPRTGYDDIIKEDSAELKLNQKGELVPVKTALEAEMEDISDITSSGRVISDPMGKAYHIGEANVDFISNYTGEGVYKADVYIKDPNNVPNATAMVIKERVGEINTYGNIKSREMVIHLPKVAEGTNLGNFYDNYGYDQNNGVRINIVFDL